MERADKIFTILMAAALVGVLVHQKRPRDIGSRLDVSTVPGHDSDNGPAYLLSALPSRRVRDDYADPVSYPGPAFA